MIQTPLSRRTVVGGALGGIGALSLTACSVPQEIAPRTVDPHAADRARISRAIDLSRQILANLGTDGTAGNAWAAPARALHTEQIDVLLRSADLTPSAPSAFTATASLSEATLQDREQALALELRTLALAAEAGDVAMLLASAAAGVDQLFARRN